MTNLLDSLGLKEAKKPEPKKEQKEKKEVKKASKKSEGNQESVKYRYPFILHYAAQNLDVSHVFEDGHEYSAEEITKKMLEHQFYEFAGKVSYDFRADDNVLIPIFQQPKKG
ncbi:hypothetical protein, partial [Holdemania massiliensis]|uniref:hypothetical protein n=1 Tax=Holdemania massiliensis TaxID=1468449 RepID=UPI00242BA5F9